MIDASAKDRLAFGPFCLDCGQGRLVMRAGERTVPLTPKAFDVLHYLAARAGSLVTKDQLLSALWADAIVGDASIKVAVREVRKAQADDADTPRYIETVHRRGYRFIAWVDAAEPAEVGAGGRGDGAAVERRVASASPPGRRRRTISSAAPPRSAGWSSCWRGRRAGSGNARSSPARPAAGRRR